jgi:hypothetical protein
MCSGEFYVAVFWRISRGALEIDERSEHASLQSALLWVLVAAVIVQDAIDDLAGRDLSLDRVEETDEFLMPAALHAADGDLPSRAANGDRSVALVVIGGRPVAARLQRQGGLGPVERLDLRLAIEGRTTRHSRLGCLPAHSQKRGRSYRLPPAPDYGSAPR